MESIAITFLPLLFLVLILLTYHLHDHEIKRAKSIEDKLTTLAESIKTLAEKMS